MRLQGEGQLLCIYVGESDHYHGTPLAHAIVVAARQHGLAGATVLHGVEGFGANSRIHTASILRLSEDLPVVIEIVDATDKIEQFLPLLDEMVQEGLIVTIEKVNVIKYASKQG